MFCPNCGKELPSSAKFCPHCGAVISSEETQKLPSQPSPTPPVKKPLQRSKFIVSISAVVICVALGVGLHFYNEYQMKVKAAEMYKERFGIEVDPNDIRLYDNLQDAMADDSWQADDSPAITASPSPEEGMITTTEYDRDEDIISVTTEPIQPAPSTQPNAGLPHSNENPMNGDGNYDDIAGTYIDEYGSGFYMFIGYDDSSKQTAYASIGLVMEDVLIKLERNGNSISGNDHYRSYGSAPSQIADMIYNPEDGSITATIYADTIPNGDTIRFVPCSDAPYSNPFYID